MLGLFGWDFIDCAVDATEAITALSDDAAIDELQCELLELIDGAAITGELFEDSLDALTAIVSGNAQKIACMLSTDHTLDTYLMFLEIYNNFLIKQDSGVELECECITETYRVWEWDFANGMGEFEFEIAPSGSDCVDKTLGTFSGYPKGVRCGSQNALGLLMPFDPAWRVHGVIVRTNRENGIGNGTYDQTSARLRPTAYSETGAITIVGGGFRPNGIEDRCATKLTVPTYWTTGNQLVVRAGVSYDNDPVSAIYIQKVTLQFVEGFHKSGYPTADTDLCV